MPRVPSTRAKSILTQRFDGARVNSFLIFFAFVYQNVMDRAPTSDEKKAVYLYCTSSKQVGELKESYNQEKRPLNQALKKLRGDMLAKMQASNRSCYCVNENTYLRLQECTTRVRLTEEMISDAVYQLPTSGMETVDTLVAVLTETLDKIRTNRTTYAKIMKTPPKDTASIEATTPDDILAHVQQYEETQARIQEVRKREKESMQPLIQTVKNLQPSVHTYMERVQLTSQRVNLGDKEIKGVAQTFFLKRKEQVARKNVTKAQLKELVTRIVEKYPFESWSQYREAIAQDLQDAVEANVEKKVVLSFGKGALYKKQ